jgi:hypothetical protein
MASKKKETPPEQLSLPGIDLDAFTKQHRANVIREEFTSDSGMMNTLSGGRRLHRPASSPMYTRDARIVAHQRGRSAPGPTNEIMNLLQLSDIPVDDFRRSSTHIVSENPSGYFSGLSRGEGGLYDQQSGTVHFDRTKGAASGRGILTHELAHAQQADLPRSVQEVELHKSKKMNLIDVQKTPDNLRGGNTSQGPIIFLNDASAVRRSATRELARFANRDTGEMDELQAVPLFHSDTPIVEGSAEAYRKRFQGPRGRFNAIYSPQFFHQTIGIDAGDVYQTAHDYTEQTGKVVPLSHIQNATRLAGVLKSDLDTDGKRQLDHDTATTHRMMRHILEKDMGVSNPSHAEEFEERMKAIEGEVVQPSLFPEMAPDVNQFGKAPTGTPERSPRGVALATGVRTEIRPEQTMNQEALRQSNIRAERRELQRGMERVGRSTTGPLVVPYESAHREALQESVRKKQHRDAELARSGNRPTGDTGTDIHPKLQEYIDKLVYDKKKSYATDYITALSSGGELPTLPKGLKPEHAENVHSRVAQIRKRHGI